MTTKAIYDVVVQIHPPDEETGFPGQVCEGKFVLENNEVTLVGHDGNAVKGHGKVYSRKLNPEENPVVVARRLVKDFYLSRRADTLKDFNRPLHYRKTGWM
jgi:hypothetical protein